MKRILFAGALALLSLSASAQGSIPQLDRVAGHRVTFHYTYSLSQNGDAFRPVTDGEVEVEGNDYRLDGLGLQVVSDGTTRWTLDSAAREMVIEKVEREDLFTNPALFIAAYPRYLEQIQVNSEGADFLDITLTLDEQTHARFLLTGIVYGPEQGKSDFTMDVQSLPSDFVITDLR